MTHTVTLYPFRKKKKKSGEREKKSLFSIYLPIHLMPFPTQPSLQLHLKLPGTLTHEACMSQLWAPISHSFTSTSTKQSAFQS